VAGRDEIVTYANALLDVERWPEFGPPGLQVVGAEDVTLLLCGVSSSRALFEHAADVGADMVLVHHGLFWRNEPLVVDRRLRARLEALFRADASLLAYHLALDAHATLGNAAQLAARIGAIAEGPFAGFGLACTLDGISIAELTSRVREVLDREPLVFPFGPARIGRVAVSTGAAGYDLIRAAHEGFDALLTGEPEEPNHATERFGVQALAAHLAATFEIEWRYLEVENPV
jgi:putative NIF3 family GTP cyclohydrolase 1 type 2